MAMTVEEFKKYASWLFDDKNTDINRAREDLSRILEDDEWCTNAAGASDITLQRIVDFLNWGGDQAASLAHDLQDSLRDENMCAVWAQRLRNDYQYGEPFFNTEFDRYYRRDKLDGSYSCSVNAEGPWEPVEVAPNQGEDWGEPQEMTYAEMEAALENGTLTLEVCDFDDDQGGQ